MITADIIGSRQQPELSALLKAQLKQFHSQSLLTGFQISRGDELQAVCRDITALPEIIRRLRYQCCPLKLRVGVGIGAIDPETMETKNSWEMNGEAFFQARSALDGLKTVREKRSGTLIESRDPKTDIALNAIYRLYDLILANWTDKQWETVHVYENQVTLMKTATVFNVSWQNIQKICKAAHWDQILKTEADLAALLEKNFIAP